MIATVVGVGFWYIGNRDSADSSTTSSSPIKFDKNAHSTTDASSIWVVVNKKRPLPADYTPANLRAPAIPLRLSSSYPEMQLRSDAADAAEQLVTAAKSDGIDLMLVSGYRSFDSQQTVYNSYVAQEGQAAADAYSARPGHSEHQTGLAADFGMTDRMCELDACFGETDAGIWLVQNAAAYGFILRYDKNNQAKVGYNYEPWHFRFVGKELAAEIKKSGQTLEEFFGLPSASSY